MVLGILLKSILCLFWIFLMPLAHIQPLLHNPVNIQLLFIISSLASGELHLSMQQWSQKWAPMGLQS